MRAAAAALRGLCAAGCAAATGGAANVIVGALPNSIGGAACSGGAGVHDGSSGEGSLGVPAGGTEPK